jgi:outer membrane biosynthesis protein TonB
MELFNRAKIVLLAGIALVILITAGCGVKQGKVEIGFPDTALKGDVTQGSISIASPFPFVRVSLSGPGDTSSQWASLAVNKTATLYLLGWSMAADDVNRSANGILLAVEGVIRTSLQQFLPKTDRLVPLMLSFTINGRGDVSGVTLLNSDVGDLGLVVILRKLLQNARFSPAISPETDCLLLISTAQNPSPYLDEKTYKAVYEQVAGATADLNDLYGKAIQQRPTLKGSITVHLGLMNDGTPTTHWQMKSSPVLKGLSDALQDTLLRLIPQNTASPTVHVDYTFGLNAYYATNTGINRDYARLSGVLDKVKAPVETTYTTVLTQKPDLQGVIAVHFKIGVDGKTSDITVDSDSLGDAALNKALTDSLAQADFGTTDGKEMAVSYSFQFEPLYSEPGGGRRTSDELLQALGRIKPQLEELYRQRLANLPKMEGEIVLELWIKQDGRLEGLKILDDVCGDQELQDGLIALVNSVDFDKSEKMGTTVVRVPFLFVKE